MKANAESEGREFIETTALPKKKNRRDVSDDLRTNLVMEHARLIKEIEPTAFLFENVQSITHSKNKHYILEFIKSMEASGYKTRGLRLSSDEYGVAQVRKRVFVIGHKHQMPGIPEITHSMGPSLFLKPIVGSGKAIKPFRYKKIFVEMTNLSGLQQSHQQLML